MNTPSTPGDETIHEEHTVKAVVTDDGGTIIERDDVSIRADRDDFDQYADKITHQQWQILQRLIRLHRSLEGPQTMLETAGHFNRPPFPPPHRPPR